VKYVISVLILAQLVQSSQSLIGGPTRLDDVSPFIERELLIHDLTVLPLRLSIVTMDFVVKQITRAWQVDDASLLPNALWNILLIVGSIVVLKTPYAAMELAWL